MSGKFVKKDRLKGFRYLELGAKLGNPNSLYELGKLYEAGITGKKETTAAISLYKLAAPNNEQARDRLEELAKLNLIDKRDDIFASTKDNGIEKITVTAPDLPKLFGTSLASIKNSGRYNNGKTCSRLSSTPCGNQVIKLVTKNKIQNLFDDVFMDRMRGIAEMLEGPGNF